MDKKALQYYAVWAKNNLEQQIEISLKTLGINSEKDIKEARKVGDFTIIDGDMNSYPADLKEKRDNIIKLIKTDGYKQVVEEFAYTWFNRIITLRFMEVHDFLPHGFRILSSRNGGIEPEIMKNLNYVKEDLKLDISVISPLLEQGKIDEAYRHVLFHQCKALSGILPMLFSEDQDYLELLLPKVLLKGETVITKLLEINEEDFLNDVEVIGWLYQFYVAGDRQAFRDAKTVTKELIPTLTQVFTPDWIVRYMAENSVGRIWLESYPNSSLKSEMKYYVEDAKQEQEVQRKIEEIKYRNVKPEDIKIIEPCCGSGHILVYIFDLLFKMYEEKGYQTREIPTLILRNNLVGLEIDKRAAQLASFSLVMKARNLNSRFFSDSYYVRPKVFEIWDSRALLSIDYEGQLRELNLLSNEEIKNIKWLVETFRYAKTIGSLLKIEKKNFDEIEKIINKVKKQAVATIFNTNLLNEGLVCIEHLLAQAKVMSAKYDVMITNPPYLGISKMESKSKEYLIDNYPNSKSDMFAMFMEVPYVKKNGYLSMVNPDSWMFLISFEELRKSLIDNKYIVNMIHLGMGSFDAVVQTTTFTIRNTKLSTKGVYFRLVDQKDKEHSFLFRLSKPYIINGFKFSKIPSTIIAYWFTDGLIDVFGKGEVLKKHGDTRQGMATSDNNRFLRLWYEVNYHKIGFNYSSNYDAGSSMKKWFPYNKGGEYRKWYGNQDYIINYENNGFEVKKYASDLYKTPSRTIKSMSEYFKECISWSKISSGLVAFRYYPNGFIFDVAGCSIFYEDKEEMFYHFGFLNSKISQHILSAISPTLNYEAGQIASLPIIHDLKLKSKIVEIVKDSINIVQSEWDMFETSWNFTKNPLIEGESISENYEEYSNRINKLTDRLRYNEETLNKYFIEIYGLENELTKEVDINNISIRKANLKSDIVSLISYLVGIEMGRFSLDADGLAYAGGDWIPTKYITYQPDNDGIIPIYTQLGMSDGLTSRIVGLLKHIYGEYSHRDNIDFIADALGKKNNESSEETLNRYLNEDFYNDHVKMYQKRPIYWMFSSGKKNAFKCLIYMHRYSEDTLAIINSRYFLNESARLNIEVNDTRLQLETAEGKDKLRLEKQYRELLEKQKEMIEYGQVLDHMASRYIHLDLDDGVKVNYAKFQGIEIVNDNGSKVKKDLLVPIK